MRMHRGDLITNGKIDFTIDNFWYRGDKITRVELKSRDNGKIYTYEILDYENAIKEGKIWKK
jgi:uncharacterized protein YhdP